MSLFEDADPGRMTAIRAGSFSDAVGVVEKLDRIKDPSRAWGGRAPLPCHPLWHGSC